MMSCGRAVAIPCYCLNDVQDLERPCAFRPFRNLTLWKQPFFVIEDIDSQDQLNWNPFAFELWISESTKGFLFPESPFHLKLLSSKSSVDVRSTATGKVGQNSSVHVTFSVAAILTVLLLIWSQLKINSVHVARSSRSGLDAVCL